MNFRYLVSDVDRLTPNIWRLSIDEFRYLVFDVNRLTSNIWRLSIDEFQISGV